MPSSSILPFPLRLPRFRHPSSPSYFTHLISKRSILLGPAGAERKARGHARWHTEWHEYVALHFRTHKSMTDKQGSLRGYQIWFYRLKMIPVNWGQWIFLLIWCILVDFDCSNMRKHTSHCIIVKKANATATTQTFFDKRCEITRPVWLASHVSAGTQQRHQRRVHLSDICVLYVSNPALSSPPTRPSPEGRSLSFRLLTYVRREEGDPCVSSFSGGFPPSQQQHRHSYTVHVQLVASVLQKPLKYAWTGCIIEIQLRKVHRDVWGKWKRNLHGSEGRKGRLSEGALCFCSSIFSFFFWRCMPT